MSPSAPLSWDPLPPSPQSLGSSILEGLEATARCSGLRPGSSSGGRAMLPHLRPGPQTCLQSPWAGEPSFPTPTLSPTSWKPAPQLSAGGFSRDTASLHGLWLGAKRLGLVLVPSQDSAPCPPLLLQVALARLTFLRSGGFDWPLSWA